MTQDEADARYPQVSEGEAIEIYSKSEINALLFAFSKTVLFSNTKLTHTGNTNETQVFSGTIPANSISANGYFEILVLTSSTVNTTNLKTLTLKINGTSTATAAVAASTRSGLFRFYLFNDGSLTSQISMPLNSGASYGFGVTSSPPLITNFNTAENLTLTGHLTLALGTEDYSIENIQVIAHP